MKRHRKIEDARAKKLALKARKAAKLAAEKEAMRERVFRVFNKTVLVAPPVPMPDLDETVLVELHDARKLLFRKVSVPGLDEASLVEKHNFFWKLLEGGEQRKESKLAALGLEYGVYPGARKEVGTNKLR
jgi:hypothetical protein